MSTRRLTVRTARTVPTVASRVVVDTTNNLIMDTRVVALAAAAAVAVTVTVVVTVVVTTTPPMAMGVVATVVVTAVAMVNISLVSSHGFTITSGTNSVCR